MMEGTEMVTIQWLRCDGHNATVTIRRPRCNGLDACNGHNAMVTMRAMVKMRAMVALQ